MDRKRIAWYGSFVLIAMITIAIITSMATANVYTDSCISIVGAEVRVEGFTYPNTHVQWVVWEDDGGAGSYHLYGSPSHYKEYSWAYKHIDLEHPGIYKIYMVIFNEDFSEQEWYNVENRVVVD